MDANTIARSINSIGLFLDIIGAWLVAIEVVKQYRGIKYREQKTWEDMASNPKESQGYENWKMRNHRWMLLGLVLLTVGFLLQVVSNWPVIFGIK